MDTKTRPIYMLSTRDPFQTRDTWRLKVKGWKKIFHANGNQNKAGIEILISDKTITNVYAYNTGAPQYLRQMLTTMKGEINSNKIIVEDFNTPLTPMKRSSKQKINKETQTLNETIDQTDLIDIFRTFHPKVTEYTFFASAHGTFSRIDHSLGHKLNLRKFKKIEIVSIIFSDHNAMRLEMNYREKNVKNTNTIIVGDFNTPLTSIDRSSKQKINNKTQA